jgi:serine/threonine-protein kinase
MTLGTPSFMPPEQARGLWDEVDGRSDIWACGATMFYLLSGSWVHNGRTPNELLLSAMTMRAPPCASIAHRAGAGIARVIDRALVFEQDQRWPDARSMQRAVRDAYGERYGAITTGPKLAVPVQVPDRTLPSATSAPSSRGSTERPVETRVDNGTRPAAGTTTGTFRPIWVTLALGGAVLLGAALTGGVWMIFARSSAMPGSSPSALQVVSAIPPSPTESAIQASPVESDLPKEVLAPAEAPGRAAGGEGSLATADAGAKIRTNKAKAVAGPSPVPAVSAAPFGYKADVPY